MKFEVCIVRFRQGSIFEFLSVEKGLLTRENAGRFFFMTWINDACVVVGRCQNPWNECDIALAKNLGVSIARRHTGGGAVFHDTGNLNFCFVGDQEIFDERRQMKVIQVALNHLGVGMTRLKERGLYKNDLKISGQAMRFFGNRFVHHGTLLVSGNLLTLNKVLRSPFEACLDSEAVKSRRALVGNLSNMIKIVSMEHLVSFLEKSFVDEYALDIGSVQCLEPMMFHSGCQMEAYRSDAWIYGETPGFSIRLSQNPPCFIKGGVDLLVRSGVVVEALCNGLDKEVMNVWMFMNQFISGWKRFYAKHFVSLKFDFDIVKHAFEKNLLFMKTDETIMK